MFLLKDIANLHGIKTRLKKFLFNDFRMFSLLLIKHKS